MFSLRTICAVTLGFLVLTMASGCTMSSPSMAGPQKAIVVTSGNSGGTAIFIPTADGTDVEMLSTTGVTLCSQCKADALKYFKTGELVPKCSMCGATRTPVSVLPPSVSHN